MTQNLLTLPIQILQQRTLNHNEYARTVELPDGEFAGTLYEPSLHQAQQIIIDTLDEGAAWVAICKPVQDGGSLASFVPILRRAHILRQTAIIAYPTMDSSKDAWSKKIWPMLSAQGGTLPKTGGGSRGGAARVVTLPTGGSIILRAGGGRNESGQASVTADAMLVDEVDDWPDMRVLRLIERRISRSRDPLMVFVSTVKRDAKDGPDRSRILRLLEQGSNSRLEYPCVHCAAFFCFEWEHIDTDDCTIVCPHCDSHITESERLTMLGFARRKDRNANNDGKFSIMWSALDSPFSILVDGKRLPTIEGIVREYIIAKDALDTNRDHGLLRQFFRDRLCRTYHGDDILDDAGNVVYPTLNRLAALSNISDYNLVTTLKEPDGESRHVAEIPLWAEYLTGGVDVQRGTDKAPGRLYWTVYGRGSGRGAVVGWGTLPISAKGTLPTSGDLQNGFHKLHAVFKESFTKKPLVMIGVDVGDRQNELLPLIATMRNWTAIKGTRQLKGTEFGDLVGWVYPRKQESGHLINLISTHDVMRVAHAELLGEHGKAGSLALPTGLDRTVTYLRHLCATVEYEPGKWSESAKDRKHHAEWSPRIDYLHTLVYARALAYYYENKARPQQRRYGVIKKL